VSLAVALLGLVSVLVLVGIGLGLAGLYQAILPFWGAAVSLAAIGGLCLLIAAGLSIWAYRWLR